jgi:hypothetical protein
VSDLPATTKTTINLPTDEYRSFKGLADRRSVSFTHALRQALQTELFVQKLVDQGAKLLVKPPEGELQQLVFTQAESAAPESVARQVAARA